MTIGYAKYEFDFVIVYRLKMKLGLSQDIIAIHRQYNTVFGAIHFAV